MSDIILSESPGEHLDLRSLGTRRCRGCVKCLTEDPGSCAIEDGFTAVVPRIMASDTLTFSFSTVSGRVPSEVMKAVERLSNLLEAYTDSGGNVPLPTDSVGLRRIGFDVRGDIDREAFEHDMTIMLRKGPVSEVAFSYS